MNHKAKHFVWVLVLFCLGKMAFAQANSPEQTARDYLTALENMDCAKAYGMTASVFSFLITEAEFQAICSSHIALPWNPNSPADIERVQEIRKVVDEASRPVSVALHSVGSSYGGIAHYRYTVFVSPHTTLSTPPRGSGSRPPQETRELIALCRQSLTIEKDESRRAYIQKQIDLIEKGFPIRATQTDLIVRKQESTGEWRVIPLCGLKRERELKLVVQTYEGQMDVANTFTYPDPALKGFILKDLNTPVEYVFRSSLLVNPGVCTKCKKKEPLDPDWKYCPHCGTAMPKKNHSSG